jgi:hypothetical protein
MTPLVFRILGFPVLYRFVNFLLYHIQWGAPEAFALPENQDSLTKRPSKEADIYSFDSIML